MSQLEKILEHFMNLAEHAISVGGDDEYLAELQILVDGIQDEDITATQLSNDHLESEGYYFDKWSYEDVLQQAEEDDISLTEEEAKIIMKKVFDNRDATIGVNWDVISYAIIEYVNTPQE